MRRSVRQSVPDGMPLEQSDLAMRRLLTPRGVRWTRNRSPRALSHVRTPNTRRTTCAHSTDPSVRPLPWTGATAALIGLGLAAPPPSAGCFVYIPPTELISIEIAPGYAALLEIYAETSRRRARSRARTCSGHEHGDEHGVRPTLHGLDRGPALELPDLAPRDATGGHRPLDAGRHAEARRPGMRGRRRTTRTTRTRRSRSTSSACRRPSSSASASTGRSRAKRSAGSRRISSRLQRVVAVELGRTVRDGRERHRPARPHGPPPRR